MNDAVAREFVGYGSNLFLRAPYYKLEIGNGGQPRKQMDLSKCGFGCTVCFFEVIIVEYCFFSGMSIVVEFGSIKKVL